jgi:hypothetical protein
MHKARSLGLSGLLSQLRYPVSSSPSLQLSPKPRQRPSHAMRSVVSLLTTHTSHKQRQLKCERYDIRSTKLIPGYPNSSQCRRDERTAFSLPGTHYTSDRDINTGCIARTVRQEIDVCASQLSGVCQPRHAAIVLHLQVPVGGLLDVVRHLGAHKSG